MQSSHGTGQGPCPVSSVTCSLAADAGEGSWQGSMSRRSSTSLTLLLAVRHRVPTSVYPSTAVSQCHHVPVSSYPNATVPQCLFISISLYPNTTVSQRHPPTMSLHPSVTTSQHHHITTSSYPNTIPVSQCHCITSPYTTVTISQCYWDPMALSLHPKTTVSKSRSVRPEHAQLLLRLPVPYSSHQTVMWE